eukprot:4297520-Amphidinium_carterae.1
MKVAQNAVKECTSLVFKQQRNATRATFVDLAYHFSCYSGALVQVKDKLREGAMPHSSLPFKGATPAFCDGSTYFVSQLLQCKELGVLLL